MNQARKSLRCRPRSSPLQAGQEVEHGLSLGKVYAPLIAAVAAVPSKGRTSEPLWLLVADEQDEFQCFAQADVRELRRLH